MIDRLVTALPVVLLALLVLTAPLWLSQSLRTSSPQEGELGRLPDYMAENFSAVERVRMELPAICSWRRGWCITPNDDTTDLSSLISSKPSPASRLCKIKSDKAKISGNNENIYLSAT